MVAMATELSSFLVTFLFYNAFLFTTVRSNDCSLPDERGPNSCISKISSGISCNGDSEVRQCYKRCEETASAFKELYAQMKVFEEVSCKKGLQDEMKKEAECLQEIFLQCKDVYNPELKEEDQCKKNKVTYATCSRPVLERHPSAECKELLETIVPAMIEMCGSGTIIYAQSLLLLTSLTTVALWNRLIPFY